MALTAALLIAATLEIKSIRNQTHLDYGYAENSLYAARMALMDGAYPSDDARRESEVEQRARVLADHLADFLFGEPLTQQATHVVE